MVTEQRVSGTSYSCRATEDVFYQVHPPKSISKLLPVRPMRVILHPLVTAELGIFNVMLVAETYKR